MIPGISIFNVSQAIETVQMKGLTLSLLGYGDGTEVIHHRLESGSRWAMVPGDGWDAFESIFLIKGRLLLQTAGEERVLSAGDFLSAAPIQEHAVFLAEEDTEFLYVSSQPVFHHYSRYAQEIMDLAVAVEEKDGYTADHCQRIMKYSMMVGEAMGLTTQQLYELNYGAFLHDVGKVKVPEEVLQKPGKLTADEWEIMKQHTTFGKQMLEETSLPNLSAASRVVEQHHERYDGSGYPHGLKGDEISIGAAIVAVVDSYDAMTTDRVYQKRRTKEEALAEIKRCQGTMYHPDVVDVFLSLADKID